MPTPEADSASANTLRVNDFALLIIAVILLFIPASIEEYKLFWAAGDNGHQPVILCLSAYLLWNEREQVRSCRSSTREQWLGIGIFVLAGVLLVIGTLLRIIQLQALSAITGLYAGQIIVGGFQLFRLTAGINVIVFSFMPIPLSLTDPILIKLKAVVTTLVVTALSSIGLPVAQNGALISIGFQTLEIAKACTGLDSMIAMLWIGVIYVYLWPRDTLFKSIIFILAVIPLAIGINAVRILFLSIMIYVYGSSAEAGAHDLAAYTELILLFVALFMIDWITLRIGRFSRL